MSEPQMSPDLLPCDPSPPPVKVERGSPPLPPVNSESLKISKRRRLEFSSPVTDGEDSTDAHQLTPKHITPAKQRSFSSPSRGLASRRTPSLQDRPIPVLSPPSASDTANTPLVLVKNQRHVSTSTINSKNSKQNTSNGISLYPSDSHTIPGSPKKRSVTSPILISHEDDEERKKLKAREMELNKEVANWRRMNSLAERAHKYLENKEDENLEEQILKWRTAAQEAANHLYNQFESHISDYGGIQAFKNRVQEKKASLSNDTGSISSQEPNDENENEDEQDEWKYCMSYLLKEFNIDFDLVFPSQD